MWRELVLVQKKPALGTFSEAKSLLCQLVRRTLLFFSFASTVLQRLAGGCATFACVSCVAPCALLCMIMSWTLAQVPRLEHITPSSRLSAPFSRPRAATRVEESYPYSGTAVEYVLLGKYRVGAHLACVSF